MGSEPRPDTTAAIVLGASEWRSAAGLFPSAPQFAESAERFRSYLLSPAGLGLPLSNFLWLFDNESDPGSMVVKISEFLSRRRDVLRAEDSDLDDIILYYVGHGGFDPGPQNTYLLTIRKTNQVDQVSSSLTIASIKRALQGSIRDARHYFILDTCFAAAALGPYLHQSAAGQTMVVHLKDQLADQGTAFLCASGAASPAKIHDDDKMTMFTHALMDVLENGAPGLGGSLTLKQVAEEMRKRLRLNYGRQRDAARSPLP